MSIDISFEHFKMEYLTFKAQEIVRKKKEYENHLMIMKKFSDCYVKCSKQ